MVQLLDASVLDTRRAPGRPITAPESPKAGGPAFLRRSILCRRAATVLTISTSSGCPIAKAITHAAEMEPGVFGRLVHLTAFVAVRLDSPFAYESLPEAEGAKPGEARIDDAGAIGVARLNPRGNRDYLEIFRRGLCSDVPFEPFISYALALTLELPLFTRAVRR